jgi:hypothetical protein
VARFRGAAKLGNKLLFVAATLLVAISPGRHWKAACNAAKVDARTYDLRHLAVPVPLAVMIV